MKNDDIFSTHCVGDFGIVCEHLKFAKDYKPVCGLYNRELKDGAERCNSCIEND
jgi:hypothetical protein